jgi:hypothetical protein
MSQLGIYYIRVMRLGLIKPSPMHNLLKRHVIFVIVWIHTGINMMPIIKDERLGLMVKAHHNIFQNDSRRAFSNQRGIAVLFHN